MSNLVKQHNQLPITSMQDFVTLGEEIAKSGLIGVNSPAAGLVVAMTCYEEGITAIDFSRTYHIIDNKLSMKSDAMLAKYVSIGGKYKILECTNKVVKIQFMFNDNDIIVEKTIDEMVENGVATKRSGGLKDNWKKFTQAMLWARCVSSAIRMIAPSVVNGVHTPEEVQDMVEEKNVTPQQEQPPIVAVPEIKVEDIMQDSEVVDYRICPIGNYTGKHWTEFSIEDLESALKVADESLSKNYKVEVQNALDEIKGDVK